MRLKRPPGSDPKKAPGNPSPRFFADERALVTCARAMAHLPFDHLAAGD